MAIFDYGVGGNVRDRNVSEGFADIPMNKTLLLQKLTSDPEVAPEIVNGLETIEKVFEHFKPKVSVEFEDLEGTEEDEELSFKTLGDFGAKGILNQSKKLKTMQNEKDELLKFMKQLKSNKVLHKILNNPEAKAAYMAELSGLLDELKNYNK